MNILVFGASGRTGVHIVEQGLHRGHTISAFVRDPAKLDRQVKGLAVVQGDVLNQEEVRDAVPSHDAVISVLGQTRNSPSDLLTRGISHIVQAMESAEVSRLLSLTGAGVRVEQDNPALFDHMMGVLLKVFSRKVQQDAEAHFERIRQSDLDWTLVRVPVLTDNTGAGEYKVGHVGREMNTRISRADVARFMLDCVEEGTYIREAPMISRMG